MSQLRIALANLPFPASPEESVDLAQAAVAEAAAAGAAIVCFPECYVPGYRFAENDPGPPTAAWLDDAWKRIAHSAATARISVVLGTERQLDGKRYISALVIDDRGRQCGFQDKVQLDPSEERLFVAARERTLFTIGKLRFGIAICHEGWRYPETVRWAARRGAHVVFHPHYHPSVPEGRVSERFADPDNAFHEMALLCRAAENTCYIASVNCAAPSSSSTSAVVRPDGTLQAYQPYGVPGLLVTDIDPSLATGELAARLVTNP